MKHPEKIVYRLKYKLNITYTPMTHMQQQRAQASVLGPDLVLVRTWCWHE